MALKDKILKEIKNNPGVLAREIARKLDVEKNKVNSLLYGELKSHVTKDDKHCWYVDENLKTAKKNNVKEVVESKRDNKANKELNIETNKPEEEFTSNGIEGNSTRTDEAPASSGTASGGFAFDSLESVRNKLLDLSGRNTLLNFRHPKSSCVRLIDELPDQIFEVLNSGKEFSFIPVPEPTEKELIDAGYIEVNAKTKEKGLIKDHPTAEQWAKKIGLDIRYELPSSETVSKGEARHQDTKLQTLLYAPELESKLRNIRSKAETAIEESGGNILYLALGFLEWVEHQGSDVVRHAPLFTLPVRLEKGKIDKDYGVYRYTLSLKDDGLMTNITLQKKLANDFELILPTVDNDEGSDDDMTPEVYFTLIKNTILKTQPTWKIRREVSLVLLNFSKQAMYQDLNPDNWPSGSSINAHEIIKRFFSGEGDGGEERGDGLSYDPEHSIDEAEDAHENFPLIYDADSSQHSALIDAVEGNNLVIEGPPGSGKSQTITNLISACIANGKKVLFVAEKMAALNVVKNRLDKAGLGDFCLELHSHKTNKVKILQDLSQRLNKQSEYRSPKNLQSEVERFEDLKDKLRKYAGEINSVWENTGLTIHEILHKATRYREHYGINPKSLKIVDIDGQSLTQIRQKELIDQASMLANIYDQVSTQATDGVIENHYWYGVQNSNLMGFEVEDIISKLSDWTNSLKELSQIWNKATLELELETDKNCSLDSIQQFKKALAELPELHGGELLSEMPYIHQNFENFSNLLDGYKNYHLAADDIGNLVKSDWIINPDTIKKLSTSLSVFNELGVPLPLTLDDMSDDVDRLQKVIKTIEDISKQFIRISESVPQNLKACFSINIDGLNEFSVLTKFINSLPQELWRHRDEIFDNPDIDAVLSQLTDKLRMLTPAHQLLLEKFSLHRLPDSHVLSQYQSTFENSGFFCFFSSEWRDAKKSVLALSAAPGTDKKQLIRMLPELISYSQGIEEIDKINGDEPVLSDIYRGIDTPIERIVALRKWYQDVRTEYGLGFGDRVAIGNAILSLDRGLATSIEDVAEYGLLDEVETTNEIISKLSARYTEFNALRNSGLNIAGENSSASVLKETLSEALENISEVLIGKTISIQCLNDANDKLRSLQAQSSALVNSDVYKKLVPATFNISINPGEYSDKYYQAGLATLNISTIMSKSIALRDSIINAPNIDRYKNLKYLLSELNVIDSKNTENKDKFCDVGSVDMSEWTAAAGVLILDVINKNELALKTPNWLSTWVDYLKLREKIYSQGLNNIVQGLESEKFKTNDLTDIVQLVIYHQLSEEILAKNKYLSDFSGVEQMAIRKRFQEYDRKLMELQREKIAYKASRNEPVIGNSSGKVSTYTEISLIKHEVNKRTRHVAVRSLLKRSKKSILAIKPCFMMSPMSVAQYLAPGDFHFDLVVMDEASQIRPEDALGVIARGTKLVVVGDPKQLPPTNFFNKVVSNDDDDVVALEDSESILESVIPIFKNRRLRWHYRSQHESLIAFSNQSFYDSNLIIFPSPFQESDEYGIRFNRCERGRFHQGRNVEEARDIVKAVSKHLIERPTNESVGLVAMNSSQQAEIELQLDQLAKEDPLLLDALDRNKQSDDPLFIKNLENVQGDERDVIMISMTYGPETVGGRTMQRFGPINQNVGWRRLNVLFTRSKKRMYIFSSMGSGDILASESSSKGVLALRNFLEYCETGHLHHSTHTGRPADSDFEIAVMRALAEHGYECEPQLGVAGYFLDLAVKDPGKPGRFIMAVECDGATYHSAKSTRDRDRLRQDILENLGWKVMRIWSTDWFKNPEAQILPIVKELDKLKTIIIESDIADALQDKLREKEHIVTEKLGDVNDANITLRDRLIEFNNNIIRPKCTNVDEGAHLLRPSMLDALLNFLPCSKAEFLETIPAYLREGTSRDEAVNYLDEVLGLIADYG